MNSNLLKGYCEVARSEDFQVAFYSKKNKCKDNKKSKIQKHELDSVRSKRAQDGSESDLTPLQQLFVSLQKKH